MKNHIIFSALVGSCILTLFSCVPARQVEEMKSNYEKCQGERDALSSEKRQLESNLEELRAKMEETDKQLQGLISDTTVMGTSLRKMTVQYDKINKLNDELLKKQSELQAGKDAENKELMGQLQALKEELQKKEDRLNELERQLNLKKSNLEKLSAELAAREKRVQELEKIISDKDNYLQSLKDAVKEALKGFENKGLTIEDKNGRLYVSMEAKLLFASGSTAIDQKGKKMLIELAKALQDEKEIEIVVEGHTDTDKINSSTIPRNNWELSVLRATAVVQIMQSNSNISPSMLSASGRSEYLPVDPNDKSKNRRIEVIIIPNLDKLFKMLE